MAMNPLFVKFHLFFNLVVSSNELQATKLCTDSFLMFQYLLQKLMKLCI
jgi:hypothetical protein